MRLAFVIQRYGLEVNGGAEMHCRLLAERLAKRHHVEIFATRALDYLEWRNHYSEGSALVNGLPVHRFTVKRRRNARVFASLSNVVFYDGHTRTEEEAWVRENGPFSPDLVRAVHRAKDRFDLFLFYCYRYYHSWAGLPGVAEKALLVPTAEDDPAIHLGIFKAFFRSPRGIVYLTPEEQQLVAGVSTNEGVPSAVIGSGLDLPEPDPALDFAARHRLERPFVLYVGRIDRMKGCLTLFAYFKKFVEQTGLSVELVLAGKAAVPIPDHPRIRAVGFITEQEKVAALQQCQVLVMPSPYESLSVITLEAWKLGVPVLANGKCRVLQGQCQRSNGGLFYEGYAEFAEALELLLRRPEMGRILGAQGRAYVEAEYSWEQVEAKLEALFAQVTPE